MMFKVGDFVELTSKTNSGSFSPLLPIRVLLLKLIQIDVVDRGDVQCYHLREEQSAKEVLQSSQVTDYDRLLFFI